jgi:hypothetical protein
MVKQTGVHDGRRNSDGVVPVHRSHLEGKHVLAVAALFGERITFEIIEARILFEDQELETGP